MMKNKLLLLTAIFSTATVSAQTDPTQQRSPIVTEQMMPVQQPGQVYEQPVKKKLLAAPAPSNLQVVSGVNKRVGIALNDTNRILTPFRKPVVKTNSTATISVEGGIIYVSSTLEEPITLFIHEVGAGDPAISLTLIPSQISPISTRVEIMGHHPGADVNDAVTNQSNARPAPPTEEAVSFETSSPYVQVLTTIMKELALEKVPQGYSLSNIKGYSANVPRCSMPGIVMEPFQVLNGSELTVYVYRATNTSQSRLEVAEERCGKVRAVAAWPTRVLNSGQSTEIYVITSRTDGIDNSNVRKPVVGG